MEQTRELDVSEKILTDPKGVLNVVAPAKLNTILPLDTALLDKAVYKTIKSQPNLNAVLRRDSGGERLFFTPLKEIREYFEELPNDTDWRNVCLKYNNNLLREDFETYPPIKVFYIQPSSTVAYLIIVYSHYAMDGTNAMSILSDILQTYSKLVEARGAYDVYLTPHAPPPSVDDMCRSAFVTPTEREAVKEKFVKHSLDLLDKCNCYLPFEEDESTVVDFLTYTSTETVLENFIARCRENQTTVGAALYAAVFFAYTTHIFVNQQNLPEELFLNTVGPVNLRGRTSPDKDISWKCGNFSVVNYMMGTGVKRDTGLWDLARSIKSDMRENMGRKFHCFDFFAEGLNNSENAKRVKNNSGGLSRQLCVSNMLKFPGALEYEGFSLESIYCTGGAWLFNTDVMEMMIYSTNKLNLTMIHRSGPQNTQRAKEIFDGVHYLVENASSEKTFSVNNMMAIFPIVK